MKKIIRNTLFVMMTSALLGSSCCDRYPGEPLGIRNNSDRTIYYWFSYWKTDNYTNYHYPDTILPSKRPIEISQIAPHNSTDDGESDPDWEKIFSELPEGKFSVYFFTEYPETQEDWDLIQQTYNLIRKDVTYQELVNNHYKIIYP